MVGFLIDEDLPYSLVHDLSARGHHAVHVFDVGLRTRPDEEILAYAVKARLALLTCDVEFGSLPKYPLGSHSGVVVCRFRRRVSSALMKNQVVEQLSQLQPDEIDGNVVIVEGGGVRLRRKEK